MRTGHSRGGGDIVADSTPTGGEAATAAPGAAATNQNPDKQWTTAKVVVLSSVPTSHDYGYLHWFRFNFHRFQPSIVFSLFTQERRNCNLCVTAFCPVKKIHGIIRNKMWDLSCRRCCHRRILYFQYVKRINKNTFNVFIREDLQV